MSLSYYSVLVCLGCYQKTKEYHRLHGLNNKLLFLTVLGAGKSKIKGLRDSLSVEDLLSAS